MDRERRDRLAKNEALFRSVNERVRAVAAELPTEGLIDGPAHERFLCECVNPNCMESVVVTNPEYERVRASPATFLVVPGHVVPVVERVVEETERFWVIQKLDHEQEIARRTDPRSGAAEPLEDVAQTRPS